MIDELSRRISYAGARGVIFGCRLSRQVTLSHLMFVDDVLAIGKTTINEWKALYEISSFGEASSLLMSKDKSVLISSDLKEAIMKEIVELFSV